MEEEGQNYDSRNKLKTFKKLEIKKEKKQKYDIKELD